MRRAVWLLVAVVFLCSLGSMAYTQVRTQEQQEKDALIANIVALRNEEARVVVLQQLLNEEIARLRQMQAVFCDQYKLDPEKFRNGLYRYDEKAGKFIEEEVAKPAPLDTKKKAESKKKRRK